VPGADFPFAIRTVAKTPEFEGGPPKERSASPAFEDRYPRSDEKLI